MDMKKLLAVIIAGTVCALIFGSLLPVWADTTASEDTLTNTGYMRYSEITSEDENVITITWDHTKPSKIIINDVEKDIIYPAGLTMSLAFADNFCFRYNTNSVDCYGTVNNTVSGNTTDGTDITLTLSSGTATVTNTDSTPKTATYTYTTAYYPNDNGSFIMKYNNDTAFVNPDSTVIVANGMTIVGNRIGVYFDGTISDGYTFNYFNTGATVTATDIVSDYTEVSNYVDVVNLSKITMHLTKGSDEVDATYNYFLVPYEITAERTVHMSGALATLVNIIPLLIAFGLVIGIAGVAIYKRM